MAELRPRRYSTRQCPLEVLPLYNAINPDAPDVLFRLTEAAPQRGGHTLKFTYADHEVTVNGDGGIAVEPARGDSI